MNNEPSEAMEHLDQLIQWLREGGAESYGVDNVAACHLADAIADRAFRKAVKP